MRHLQQGNGKRNRLSLTFFFTQLAQPLRLQFLEFNERMCDRQEKRQSVKRGIADFGARFCLCDRAPRTPPLGGGYPVPERIRKRAPLSFMRPAGHPYLTKQFSKS